MYRWIFPNMPALDWWVPMAVGKTTLLQDLVGRGICPRRGRSHRAQGLKVGYLPQEAIQTSDRTLWQECLLPFEHLIQMQSELAAPGR